MVLVAICWCPAADVLFVLSSHGPSCCVRPATWTLEHARLFCRSFAYANPMASLPITWQHDADYESARIGRVFNYRRPRRYPVAVVEASEESHIEADHLTSQKQCRFSIRSGGRSWAVWSVRDDAVRLDLGN
ncbi:hypothetical protein IWX50DRAFT_252840 [Phyllosticta citricarpa]